MRGSAVTALSLQMHDLLRHPHTVRGLLQGDGATPGRERYIAEGMCSAESEHLLLLEQVDAYKSQVKQH